MPADQQETRSLPIPPSPPGVFGTKIPSTVTFAVALFLFVLPFAELKCKLPKVEQNAFLNLNAAKLSFTNTGLGLAFGNDWKFSAPIGNILQNEQIDSWKKTAKPQKPNYYAIVALAFAVLGLGLSFMSATRVAVITTVAGGIAAGALIGLMVDLQKKSNDIISEIQNAGSSFSTDYQAKLSLSFTPWFYIAVIAMITATVFSYMRILSARR